LFHPLAIAAASSLLDKLDPAWEFAAAAAPIDELLPLAAVPFVPDALPSSAP